MRRPMFALAIALILPILTATSQTSANAEVEPATALKHQLISGRGVKFSQVTIIFPNIPEVKTTIRGRGLADFGNGKITAIDLTHSKNIVGQRDRIIAFTDRSYSQGVFPDSALPEGKSWVADKQASDLAIFCGEIALSAPAVLSAVLATAAVKRPAGVYEGKRTTLHEGKITFGELYKVDPGLRLAGNKKPTGKYVKYAKLQVSWRLWLGQDQLVRRCWTSWSEPSRPGNVEEAMYPLVADTRLSSWGIKTHIKPPPAAQVATVSELNL
jgi:hypothetical protein